MRTLFLCLIGFISMGISSSFAEHPQEYLFKKGLFLNSSVVYGRTSIIADPVINAFFSNQLQPQSGKAFSVNIKNSKWEDVTCNEKGDFLFPEDVSGHLYLTYQSNQSRIVWFKSVGNTMSLINGLPHEGDHYSFGWTIIPVKLKKGLNEFLLTSGRNQNISARILDVPKPVKMIQEDQTLPDLIIGENNNQWAALRIINSTESRMKGLQIQCISPNGTTTESQVSNIEPLSTFKSAFKIPTINTDKEQQLAYKVILKDKQGKQIDELTISINIKNKTSHHSRTFISDIDHSVQYYSVSPGTIAEGVRPALFLSVHGASVEARNQAAAYEAKNWGHVIAPTNRRPYGFGWEDWGRLDALEVLQTAERLFNTDPKRTYLTGHSMGGHGTWNIGANYPDRFAAIAPCSGYADILGYANPDSGKVQTDVEKMMLRANNACRTLSLAKNYLHDGVYVLHGDSDETVPIYLARAMRNLLGTFHPDFCYYEYPGGKHWYGNQCVDWPRMFDYLQYHTLAEPSEIKNIDFTTASPGVSSSYYWIQIYQQEHSYQFSNVKLLFNPKTQTINGTTQNVAFLVIKKTIYKENQQLTLKIDNQTLTTTTSSGDLYLRKNKNGLWSLATELPSPGEKSPLRYGTFKDAFRHNMIFVYATKGNEEENAWYFNKAQFDAETFLYRGNASVRLIKDTEFNAAKYPDCGVILYGNASNNAAWHKLLSKCPLSVKNNEIIFGARHYKGTNLGCYFTWPRDDSNDASVGIIAGTGIEGMKACYANQYFLSGTGYPDVTIFNNRILTDGYSGVLCSGFFGNKWNIEEDFYYQ